MALLQTLLQACAERTSDISTYYILIAHTLMKQCTFYILHGITSHLQVSQVNFNDLTSSPQTLNQHIARGILWVRGSWKYGAIESDNHVISAGFISYFPEFERINREK